MRTKTGQFAKGASGNPQGRPPGSGRASIRDLVRAELSKIPAGSRDGLTTGEALARRLVASATDHETMLGLVKWLEGSAPSADSVAAERTAAALAELEDASWGAAS